ncbi:UDP-galactopyranose mutase [Tritrichomonas foetus]|uniref:UDP-galactopyranose mutase n=1 Tax=Tritrichomonas foetus TaxID=1144522 RepID=A0A1J4K0X2_9EUKA|nr:UDP-galactopyranose mutase [Tritrichomonas foetus]|eukprot:OHT04883.1 UDP-galactopyranose mutase [Tritrichomonas foetus]
MSESYDCIIVGAGFAGIVAARELAERGNKKVLILERHEHIGGNCYDVEDKAGVLIHQYGPHIFHTYNKRVFEFLSRFTEWRKYDHCVIGNVYGKIIPIPFNLNSLHIVFDEEKANRLEKKLVDTFGIDTKVPILELRKSEDQEIRDLAEYVYENVFLKYTMKQWGKKPNEIDPAVTGRVPVYVSRDNRYFQDTYQGMPLNGYTPLAKNIADHPNITIRYSVDCRSVLKIKESTVEFEGKPFTGIVIFTGQADELFGRCYGMLPYRTLDFHFETHDVDVYQPGAVVNYTVDQDYTRITEFKYLTGQVVPNKTTIVKEFSKPYEGKDGEIPYYTIANPDSLAMYQKYVDLVKKVPNLYLLGRLAEFKYYNIDGIVARALELSDQLLEGK